MIPVLGTQKNRLRRVSGIGGDVVKVFLKINLVGLAVSLPKSYCYIWPICDTIYYEWPPNAP